MVAITSIAELVTRGLFPCAESEIRHVGSFSGGAGSWAAMKRVAATVPKEQITLLFADTIIEDQDTYRLVIEGAANIFGVPSPGRLIDAVLSLPDLSLGDPHCRARKAILAEVRGDAMRAIPGLTWIAEGRHPWEVFEDRKFIGNSLTDPCSLVLKREFMDSWRNANCHYDATVCYVGIDYSEKHRLDRMLPLVRPWKYEAPLCIPPLLTKGGVLKWMLAEGIRQPRAYGLGFPHNNCGGFCCKAGHAHFALLYRAWPLRFAWHEWWENRLRAIVGDYSMMSDRRGGGGKKPMTLTSLRERIEAGEDFGQEEWGGCGCALAS